MSTITSEIYDVDGDSFNVSIDNESEFSTISNVTPIIGSDVTVSQINDRAVHVVSNKQDQIAAARIEVSLAPNYGDAGSHSLEVQAIDINGNNVSAIVRYYVEHVNRAPIAMEQEDIEIGLETTSYIVDFASLFQDPDGDDLTYTVSLSEDGIVDMFSSTDRVIFVGKKIGETTITVVATDTEKATTTNTFKVKVVSGTGLHNTILVEVV